MTNFKDAYIVDESSGLSADVIAVNGHNGVVSMTPGHVSTDNSTSTPLGVGGVFTGDWEDITNVGVISLSVYSDVASATDGLNIQFSSDGVNVDIDSDKFTVPADGGCTKSFQAAAKYYRIVYTNGGTGQTDFRLQSVHKPYYVKPSSHRIADGVSSQDDAELVKAVLTGKKPDGEFINYNASRNGNLRVALEEYGDTAAIDPFGRSRVSEPYSIFDCKLLHDDAPLSWDEETAGSATTSHSTTNAAVTMSVTSSATDYAIRQTKRHFNYQPGKGQLIFITYYGTQQTGVTKRIGLFSGDTSTTTTAQNGVFLSVEESDVTCNIAKNGTVTETVSQASWNKDTLDGSGDANNPSGIELDTDAPQILFIDYEWLGVGRVRMGFVIGGLIYVVHDFNHSNNSTFNSVYMSTPNLPLRYDIQADGSGAGGSLEQICCSVISEGGREDNGTIRYASTGGTHVDANTENTIYAIMGIRLKATALDTTIKLIETSISETTGDKYYEWIVLLNPTVADTFTYSDQTNSSVQIATGATANTVTGGTAIGGGMSSSGDKGGGNITTPLENALLLGSTIDGTPDEIVLCIRPVGGSTNIDIEASLSWRELA